ncbi:MAG: hypothetical protein P1V97_34965, partial [Planctomycetota bacterium]|nr:hypothetical protein [Planctomycetota bacterium]
ALQVNSYNEDFEAMSKKVRKADFDKLENERRFEEEQKMHQLFLKHNRTLQSTNKRLRNDLTEQRTANSYGNAEKEKLEREYNELLNKSKQFQRTAHFLNSERNKHLVKQRKWEQQYRDLQIQIKSKQRIQDELERVRKDRKLDNMSADFQLAYYSQQVKHLYKTKNAEEIVRAGRLPQILKDLESETSRNRVNLIHKIAEIGPTATLAITPLIKRLGDFSLNVRLAAIGALRAIGPNASVALTSLKKLYKNCESDPLEFEKSEIDQLRLSILRSYGDFGFQALRAVPELEAALEHDSPEYVLAALESLTKLAPISDWESERTRTIRKTLRREIISLDFADTPIEDALGFIGQHIGLKIEFSEEFKHVIKSKNPMVNLRLRLISVQDALRLVLSSHGDLGFKVILGRLSVFQKDEKATAQNFQRKDEDSLPLLKKRALKSIQELAKSSNKALVKKAQESLKRINNEKKSNDD